MTRSQTIAMLAALSSVTLLGGLTWRAHAPDNWTPRLPFFSSDAPSETTKPDAEKIAPAPLDHSEAAVSPAPVERHETAISPISPTPDAVPTQERPATVAPPAAVSPLQPQFDVVRIEPSGESVIAGRGRPGDKIRVVAADKVLAEALADASGQFVVTPTLPPGNYELSLRDTDASVSSQQSVTVSIGRKGDERKAVAALTEPGQPTVLLTPPAGAPPSNGLAFLTADVEKNGFYATGIASPKAHLRIYADDKVVADVTAGPDGRWSMRVGAGLSAGPHKLRADSLDALGLGQVVARAEISLEVPAVVAEGKTELVLSPKPDEPNTIVQRGDTLWKISRRVLGSGQRYTQIFAVNNGQIRNPNLIYPGQVLAVPPSR